MGLDAVHGVVIDKYKTGEHGEIQLPFRGVGIGGVSVAPQSCILSIDTGSDTTQEIVVNKAVFDTYEVGDDYPGYVRNG